MTNNKPNFETIYLVQMSDGWAWSTEQAPDPEHNPDEAVKYVHSDFVDHLTRFALKGAAERVRTVSVSAECAPHIEEIIKAIMSPES